MTSSPVSRSPVSIQNILERKLQWLKNADESVHNALGVTPDMLHYLEQNPIITFANSGRSVASAGVSITGELRLSYHPMLPELYTDPKTTGSVDFVVGHEIGHHLERAKRATTPEQQKKNDRETRQKFVWGSKFTMHTLQAGMMLGLMEWNGKSASEMIFNAAACLVTGMGFRYVMKAPARREELYCDAVATAMSGVTAETLPPMRDKLQNTSPGEKIKRWFHKNIPQLYQFYDPSHPPDQKRIAVQKQGSLLPSPVAP